MMSKKLEVIINEAIRRANDLKHEYLTLENVLLAMLSDEQVREILIECGAEVEEVKNELSDFIKDDSNFSILNDEQIKELSQKQFVNDELRELAKENGILYQPEISMALQRVIQRAAIHVQSSGKRQIKGINLLVALFQEKESYALYTLEKQGVERFDVVRAISHGPVGAADEAGPKQLEVDGDNEAEEVQGGKGASFLEKFAINLNEQAHENLIDPLVGRRDEVLRIIQILFKYLINLGILCNSEFICIIFYTFIF